MNSGRTVFSQLIEQLPNKEFQKCVNRYRGDHYVKKFSCWDQFLSMAFAQLTYRDGLRDIESCLQSVGSKLYHMAFAAKSKGLRWPTPMNFVTGASTRTLQKFLSKSPARFMPIILS